MVIKRLFIFFAVFLLLMTGCQSKQNNNEAIDYTSKYMTAEEKILKIGVFGPFTGPLQDVGREFKDAVQMAFEPIKNKVGDYRIEFVYIDSESDTEKALAAYEKAITVDKIDATIMGWDPEASTACMNLAADYKVPHFFCFGVDNGTDIKLISNPEKYQYWIGKAWPAAIKLARNYVEALEVSMERGTIDIINKNVVVFGTDESWSQSFAAALKGAFTSKGWNCVANIRLSSDESNFSKAIDDIKHYNPTVIAGTTLDPGFSANFLKQAKENKLDSIYIVDGLNYGDWQALAGDSAQFVLDQIPAYLGSRSDNFIKTFTQKYGYEPNASIGGMCYDWSSFFIKVMQVTLEFYGEITSETLTKCGQEYLLTGEISYTSGTVHLEYKYDKNSYPDMIVSAGYYMFPVVQYIDGSIETIWPDSDTSVDMRVK